MGSPLKSLVHDDDRYQRSFHLFLERSSEHQCMRDFIHSKLPDILSSIGDGKSHLNVIGVGSGAGEIDLEMLSELHKKHPEVTVDNEVVEPSSQQLHNYKVLVSQKPELNYIKYTWNKMTASEFEEHWKLSKTTKKADFIHMIQMLYYVKDPGATISFFQSLLDKNGKLLIILVSAQQLRNATSSLLGGESVLQREGSAALCGPVPSSLKKQHKFKGEVMSAETHTCYEGCNVNIFQFYLEKSGEHAAIVQCLQNVLPAQFQRIGAGKSSLDVLGVGSGGGEMDVQILSLLQSAFPSLPITTDIVEGSSELTANFKASAAKTADLKKIQFSWHIMSSEDYEKAKAGIKKFDFVHMIQMIYYVKSLAESIKFHHGLLKNNGRLMIIVEAARNIRFPTALTSQNALTGAA